MHRIDRSNIYHSYVAILRFLIADPNIKSKYQCSHLIASGEIKRSFFKKAKIRKSYGYEDRLWHVRILSKIWVEPSSVN